MKKVLIVDDEVDLCMMVKIYLTKRNYDVYTANSLGEGLEKLRHIRPDALLLDNNLPDGKGWKMANNLQAQFPDLHITLVSAHHDAQIFKNQLGFAFNILEKPLSLKAIEQYL